MGSWYYKIALFEFPSFYRLKDRVDQQLTLLLPLLQNAAECYLKRNAFFDFLTHLFQLDSPNLFTLVRVNDGSISPEPLNEFQIFLKSYIEDNDIYSSIHTQIYVLLVRDITKS